MANGQARLAFSLRSVLGLLRDIAGFVRDPAPPAVQLAWGRAFVVAFVLLCLLDAGLAFASEIPLWAAEAAGYAAPAMADLDLSPAEDWIFAVAIAPVVEEAMFRGWLSGRRASLEFAERGLGVLALLLVAAILFETGAGLEIVRLIQVVALAIGLYALVIWLRERKQKTDVPAWFDRNYRYFVWGSALAFGAIHLTNYDELTGPIDLLLVLSQTLGGLVLAYTRTRLGLGAAMAQHSLFNAVLTAADL
jgi:membrane protease YdiL (CAAX protease family)